MFNVYLYFETGFNPVNLPFSPAALDADGGTHYFQFPAIDVLQKDNFAEISIKITIEGNIIYLSDLEKADYLVLEDTSVSTRPRTYYTISGYQKTSADVVKFSCVMDYITTLGGIQALSFSDGIIERQSINSSENIWEAEVIDDELLGCNRPLVLNYEWCGDDATNLYELIESTIDLSAAGISYSRLDDAGTGGASAQSALVPTMQPASSVRTTSYRISVYNPNSGQSTPRTVENVTGGEIFKADETNVQARIADARSLGIENGILNQYVVPMTMITAMLTNNNMLIWGQYAELTPTENELKYSPSGLGYTPIYARVLQGINNRYGLISCTGDKIEYNPEDIRLADEQTPVIQRIVDPRAEGRPYYQSKYFHRRTTPELFNAVAGAKWAKLPLKYTQVSGFAVMEQQFKNTSKMSARQFQGTQAQLENAASATRLGEALGYIGGVAGLAASGGQAIAGYWGGENPAGDLRGAMGEMGNFFRGRVMSMAATNAAEIARDTSFGVYQRQRQKELYDYGVTAYTVAPEVQFPSDLNTLRSLRNNGVLLYKYRPDVEDLKRHDKVLNMYGIKCFKSIQELAPDNGINFFYVKIRGAKVSGKSILLSEGASAQLSAGVRFWKHHHVRVSDYNTSNINTV